jgi:hypothetical protein
MCEAEVQTLLLLSKLPVPSWTIVNAQFLSLWGRSANIIFYYELNKSWPT